VRPDGSFSAWLRQQNLEIGALFLRFYFLARRKNLSPGRQVHLISGYLE